jgi:hypothetical protein
MSIDLTLAAVKSAMNAAVRFGISFDILLRLFETGDREEDRIVSNLRAVGVTVWERDPTVWERDPDTGKQVSFEACGGHFALSLDGVGEGFKESKKPHTLEFKTMNDKNFKATKNMGVETWALKSRSLFTGRSARLVCFWLGWIAVTFLL